MIRETPSINSGELNDRLETFNGVDREISFKLPNQKDEKGNTVAGDVFWTSLKDSGHMIEGKLFCPERNKSNRELIIFEPGFPGDGVILFDSRHAPKLVSDGFHVFTARHQGLNVEARRYLNCPEKHERASIGGQKALGNFSFEEWGQEALTAIKSLEGQFDKIHLVGHSMGAQNIFNSLIKVAKDRPDLVEKIGTVVSLAGAVGRWRPDGTLDPDGAMTKDRWRFGLENVRRDQLYKGVDVARDMAQVEESYHNIYKGNLSNFKNTRFIFTSPDKILGGSADEYNPYSASLEFANHLKDQGLSEVVVKKYRTIAPRGTEAHDLTDFSANFLEHWIKDKI